MPLANPIKKVKQTISIFSKTTLLHKILYFLAFLVSITLITNYGNQQKIEEGFKTEKSVDKNTKKFDMHNDVNNIYDDFYVNIYDDMVFSKNKIDYEIGKIIAITKPKPKYYFLDIGSGTGHHVSSLQAHGYKAEGIDISPSMVKKAKTIYPELNYKVADTLDTTLYPSDTFNQITCFYFTIYYIKEKEKLFENCMKWLVPGGYLSIHLVNRDKFDPIIPAGNPFSLVSVQKYAKKRITSTTVKFDNFEYKSNFDMKEQIDQRDSPNAFFVENFKDLKKGTIRQNEHQFYMSTQSEILDIAKKAGFIIHAKIDLMPCQYEHQYIYILQKPT